NPDSATGQTCLSQAHQAGDRVECRCRVPAPPMYVAAVGGRFIVKRMPGTGPDHAVDCPSFLPPDELSGLAQVQTSAITEDPDVGTTTLKLGFPLRKNSKSRTAPEQTGANPTEAKVAPRKLTITSVLHFLWHEADLGKWYPRMEGKRFWGVIHSALRRASAAKIVKGQDLSRILYVPEYFKPEKRAEIAARRNRIFANLRPDGRGATPFGLVIAEYKGMVPTAHGARFTFKHAPDCAFFADADLAEKFDKVFGDQLRLIEAMGSGHAIVIASFSIANAGYPVLHEIGMMLVTDNWIPFESLRELEVLNALTEQSRAFQKQMRFNLPADAPIASAVLLDTSDPVAVFVADNPDDAGALALLTKASEEGRYPSWCWFDNGPMRPFPGRSASPSSHHSRTPEGGATGQSVRPSPVVERRASGDERDTMWDSPILPKGASDHG
ncbi:DUF1173 family protein, partial [Ruegeria sp. NA]